MTTPNPTQTPPQTSPEASSSDSSSQNVASLVTIIIVLVIGALVALAGSWNSATLGGVPLFALAVAAAFLIQIVVFIPSAIARNERFFDLTGSGTFALISVGLLILAPARDLRTVLLGAMVILWALRLGTFLTTRIHRAGSDDRFDDIKSAPLPFLRVWILQGLWISVTASAAWIAMSAADRAPLDALGIVFAIVGVLVWIVGFTIEVVADRQKSVFKADAANRGAFIRSGLWSRSRHPNYFGEIVLWIGVFLVAAPVLSGWQWIAVLSPVLVTLLLTRVSGIPLLEAKSDARWGGQDEYEAYKKRTPLLIPRLTK